MQAGTEADGSLRGMTTGAALGSSDAPLSHIYDLSMLDLDGVVYVGNDAVPGAAAALAQARGVGMRLAYVTNNASRTPKEVADHLRALSMPEADVVTAAQAVAHLVADALPAGAAVLLVGGEGLRGPLEERGLVCVDTFDDGPVAVVQGFHPDVGWRQLAEAAYAIQSGLPWYASNTDMTIPTPRGIAPGNGALVKAVSVATGTAPIVAGKPEAALFRETIERVGGEHPLMVGDRLDTDIDGAINVGIDSLVVLTGVNSLQDIVDAGIGHRPTYVGADLSALMDLHPPVVVERNQASCGDSVATVSGDVLTVDGPPRHTASLRTAVGLAWHVMDRSGIHVQLDGTMDV